MGTSYLGFHNETGVLRTTRMVRLDWQREVEAPGALPCIRTYLTKGLPPNATLVSFRTISLPRIARYVAAYLLLVDVTSQGLTVHTVSEFVFAGQSRTEIGLFASGANVAPAAVAAASLRLTRTLVARVQA